MKNLLAAINCEHEVHLIIGTTNAVSFRIKSCLEAGATPVLLTTPEASSGLTNIDLVQVIESSFDIEDITQKLVSCGRTEVGGFVDRLFVALPIAQESLKKSIFEFCTRNRIPINTTDSPDYCTFTLLASYESGDFKFGVTTGGKGCKLASRIKRELVHSLPPNIADICNQVGKLRKIIQEEDRLDTKIGEHEEDVSNTIEFNALVEEFNMTQEQKRQQRARFLNQIVEYYPLSKMADISVDDLCNSYHKQSAVAAEVSKKSNGSIYLVGAGPGSVSLLTIGALHLINTADLILADKLVPQQVLDLIPKKRTEVYIAKKFPGNAERAQEELLQMGLNGLQKGLTVVRLKQGDPYIFGRGGEEYNFFAGKGYTPVVLPGITSALAAPVVANIPVTHREVADQVLICTGTGRRGVLPHLPEFVKSRTTVFLMALHRITELIPQLIELKDWDPNLPVAIIERASSPDQRIIRTTLSRVAEAVEACGSRPPGLLVTGYSCGVINGSSTDTPWQVEEGYDSSTFASLQDFTQLISDNAKI